MTPRRILMTVDAVGGVWRYAMDLAAELRRHGVETVFQGFGPRPSPAQAREAMAIGALEWSDLPLDWTTSDEAPLERVPEVIRAVAAKYGADLVQVNVPSQAAGLDVEVPVVAVAHSCVATWFDAVRGTDVPDGWRWQAARTRRGLLRADVVVAPSRSHADHVRHCHGPLDIRVVHNASRFEPVPVFREPFVFAAGRWWDDGKNGAVLDMAAAMTPWQVVMAGSVEGPNGQYFDMHYAKHAGDLSHAETMALMTRAAIVVSPSLYEPFGLAALEGARAGAALVLADIPTYRELWTDAALFADAHDPYAFTAAIEQLAADAELRTELGQAARRRAAAFTPEGQARGMIDLYSGVCARSLAAAE